MNDHIRIQGLEARKPPTMGQVERLSKVLRRKEGYPLFPHQAAALIELAELDGLFAPMPTGTGKTLVTLLAATLLRAERPVLLIPADLRQKTRTEYAEYCQAGWRARLPRIVSYTLLAMADNAELLTELAPDLIIADEAHKLKNPRAAVTRRVMRYIQSHPSTRFAALSGTLITDELMDYWHIMVAALRERAPLPLDRETALQWAEEDRTALLRASPIDYEHMRTRRGIVTVGEPACTTKLLFKRLTFPMPDRLADAIAFVQTSKLSLDMEPLDDWDLPKTLGRLALGFGYVWDPPAPDFWKKPRRAWFRYVQVVLDLDRPEYESPEQVARNPPCARGEALQAAWRAVRDDFVPNKKTVWVDPDPLDRIAEYAKKNNALVWVRSTAAGEYLAEKGLPWYPGGREPPTSGRGPMALQIKAHGTGKNLQAWNHMVIAEPPSDESLWEQIIARCHRKGQDRDVTVAILSTIDYHSDIFDRARLQSQDTQHKTGMERKLWATG